MDKPGEEPQAPVVGQQVTLHTAAVVLLRALRLATCSGGVLLVVRPRRVQPGVARLCSVSLGINNTIFTFFVYRVKQKNNGATQNLSILAKTPGRIVVWPTWCE